MHHPPPRTLDWDDLPGAFPGFPEPERWLPVLRRHFDAISTGSTAVRTTTVSAEEAPRRLYGESLETLRLALLHSRTPVEQYIDVGSGGGFPGLVAGVIFPLWKVALVEAHGRTAALLAGTAAALSLDNVTVVNARAEEAGRGPLRERGDLVTARAVAELRVALEYTAPLARVGGVIGLPKGSRLPQEERDAEDAARLLGVSPGTRETMRPEVSATPWTAIFRKERPTPDAYPRRPGTPSRRPL